MATKSPKPAPKKKTSKPKKTWEQIKKEQTDKTINHQVMLRGQYTRIAKRATSHLMTLREATKEELQAAQKSKKWKAAKQLKATFARIDEQITEQYRALGKGVTEDMVDLYVYEKGYTETMFDPKKGEHDIDLATVYALVESDPFDGKILSEWTKEQEISTQHAVRRTVRLGILNGLSDADIVDALIEDGSSPYNASESNVKTLVRTAGAHVTAQADLAGFQNSGVKKYQISSVLDTRTTKICAALDQKVYKVSDKKKKVPPFHPNCRSTMIAMYDDDEPLGDTFEQWLAKQPKEKQLAVLGAERQKMWESGLPIDRFVDLDTLNVIPLDELRKLDKKEREEN